MKKLIFSLSILAFLLSQRAFAQPSYYFTPAILEVDEGDGFCLDLKVQDFTFLTSVQFTIKFDPAVLEFDHLANLNASTTGLDISDFNVSTAGLGYITFIWSDGQPCQNAVYGVTLPDDAVLFSICFKAVGQYGMHTPVYFANSPVDIITRRSTAQCFDIGEYYLGDGFVSIGTSPLKIDISSANGDTGENVCIDFRVRDFQDLVSVQYFIFYDPTILEFVPNSLLKMNLGNAGDPYDVSHNPALHMISSNWQSPNAQNGVSLPNGTQILQACFKVIGNCGQSSPITIGNNSNGTPPEPIEVLDEISVAAATNIGLLSTPGKVTVNCLNPNGITINMADNNACNGETFTVDVKVEDFSQIAKLKFDLKWNPSVIAYQSVVYPVQSGGNCLPWSTGFNAVDAPTQGLIHMDWSSFGQGCSKMDGYILFRLTFKVVGQNGASTNISVVDPIFVDKFGGQQVNIGINANNSYVQVCGLASQTINFPSIADKLTTSPPFDVAATASSGLPVTLAIVSGPATLSGNTISLTGSVGTVTVSANQAGNAQYNPAPQVLRTFTVGTSGGGGGLAYCASSGTSPWQEWISKVQLNTIGQVSQKSTFSDFTAISTNLTKGVNYPISLTAGYSYTSYNEYFRVWIDYNINGIFEANEIAYQGILSAPPNGSLSGVLNGSLTVPVSAVSGTTRMRVAMQRGAYPTACQTFQNGEVEDYSLTIGTTSGNGALPQTISFAQLPNQLTTSPPLVLNATASSGLPVSFGIVSGPATIAGNTLTLSGIPGTLIVRATQAGNAQYLPATEVQVSFTVSAPLGSGYCTVASSFPWHEWISRVQFGAINNVSNKDLFTDFTSISAPIVRGTAYPVAVTVTYSYTTYIEYCRIWIDYNGNAVFEDTEIAYEGILTAPPSGSSASGTLSGNILVPAGAALGSTRMRVSVSRGAYPAACGPFTYGEVEDYSVSIADNFQAPGPGEAKALPELSSRNSSASQVAIEKTPDIKVYPNPAKDAVNIQLADFEGHEITLRAYNSFGHLVYLEKIDCCRLTDHRINTFGWQAGVYALVIDDDTERQLAYKIMIVR